MITSKEAQQPKTGGPEPARHPAPCAPAWLPACVESPAAGALLLHASASVACCWL